MPESRLKLPRTLAFVLAGGRVGELSVLTLVRPKAAVPFGGIYRIIDFTLSNLIHSGVPRLGVLPQYQPASLIEHVGAGQSWDLLTPGRTARILPPYHGPRESNWYRGNADAVRQNLDFVRDHDPELVLILAGDHVYHMDYRPLIRFHMEREADVTVAFRHMGEQRDTRFGYGVLGNDGKLTDYQEKPASPPSDLASLTIYVFRREVLEKVLAEGPDDELEFGKHLIPTMLEDFDVYGWIFDGYWAYCRTPSSYFRSNFDVIRGAIDPDGWGVRTNLYDQDLAKKPASRLERHSAVTDSLFADGCVIGGNVTRSILGAGVRIERDASVTDSILFHDTVVESGAVINGAILDKRVVVRRNAVVGAPVESIASVEDCDLAMLGKGVEVPEGSAIGAGEAVATGGSMTRKAPA